jgi:hypothetical protein
MKAEPTGRREADGEERGKGGRIADTRASDGSPEAEAVAAMAGAAGNAAARRALGRSDRTRRADVGRGATQRLDAVPIPARLMLRVSDDRHELEAESVSDSVARGFDAEPGAVVPSPSAREIGAPVVVRRAVDSPSRMLDAGTRRRLESSFDHDLRSVRIHTGPTADAATRAVGAAAFTAGNHIVFGEGRYRPSTPGGQRLLTHEVTHVVQQQNGGVVVQRQELAEYLATDRDLVEAYINGATSYLVADRSPSAARAALRERAFELAAAGDLAGLHRLARIAREAAPGPVVGPVRDRAAWVESLMMRSASLVERALDEGTQVSDLLPSAGVPTGRSAPAEEMTIVQRQAAHTQLSSRLDSAETNFVNALGSERAAIEAAADAEGELLKLVVGAAFSFVVTPGIGRALTSLANTISVDASITTYRFAIGLQDHASGIAGTISSVAKPKATEAIRDAGQPPTEYAQIADLLTTSFQGGKDELVGYVGGNIQNRDALPDEDLLLLVAAWDPTRRTPPVYREGIRDVLEQFRDQVLRIGERRTTGVGTFFAMGNRRSIRWVRTSTGRRLALVSISYPGGGHGSFLGWVDPAFERAAIHRWRREPVARNEYGGRIDADEPQTVAPDAIGAPTR